MYRKHKKALAVCMVTALVAASSFTAFAAEPADQTGLAVSSIDDLQVSEFGTNNTDTGRAEHDTGHIYVGVAVTNGEIDEANSNWADKAVQEDGTISVALNDEVEGIGFMAVRAFGDSTIDVTGDLTIYDDGDGTYDSDFTGMGTAVTGADGANIYVHDMNFHSDGIVRSFGNITGSNLFVENSSLTALAGMAMADEAPAQDDAATDFTWNGQKEVWSILPTTGVPGLLVHSDSMGYEMEKEGWIYAAKDAQGQPANQVEFVEQAIAAGNVGALMIAAMDVDLLEDVCAEAKEAGIAVTMLGVAPQYPVAGYIATAYDLTGQYAVYAAQDWIENRVAEGGEIPINEDGKYEVAVDYYTGIIDGIYRSNAIFGTIEESDNLVAVSATQSYGNSSFDEAYSNAQATLSANPNCRVFICYEPDNAMGIATACGEYAEINGLDLADFCVIPCYSQDDTFMEMVAEVTEDHSANAIKGYASFGGVGTDEQNEEFHAVDKYANDLTYSATGGKLAAILLGVCGSENYEWDYNTPFFDDITAWNVYGFELHWQQGEEDTAEQYRVDQFLY